MPSAGGALLAEEAVVRAALGDQPGDQLLRGDVHLGDDVDRAGLGRGDREVGRAAVPQQRARAAGGLLGEFEQFRVQAGRSRGSSRVGAVGARGGGPGGAGRAAADRAEVVARAERAQGAGRDLLPALDGRRAPRRARGPRRRTAGRRRRWPSGASAAPAPRPWPWPPCRGRTGPPCGRRRTRWARSRRPGHRPRAAPPGGRRCRAPATGCAGRRSGTGRRAARGGRRRCAPGRRRRSAGPRRRCCLT